jgi:hypothetical protein
MRKNRYEEITKIMVNEFGYEITEQGISPVGNSYWKLRKKMLTENNQLLDDEIVFENGRTKNELAHDAFDHMLPLIKQSGFK